MAGSGRIYQRAEIYFIAYSHGGREFRESSRSRHLEEAQRLRFAHNRSAVPPVSFIDFHRRDIRANVFVLPGSYPSSPPSG
jgi:hypothetical protein